jgi:hypothetical protein
LDAAHDFHLSCAHRAILAQIARRLQAVKEAGDVVKFLAECVVPLANRGLDRSAGALARASVKRLLKHRADAMTLHRAMGKLELAGTAVALKEIATLLYTWRRTLKAQARRQRSLVAAAALVLAGIGALLYVLFVMNGGGMLAGKTTTLTLGAAGRGIEALWAGPALLMLAGFSILPALATGRRKWRLPQGRGPITSEEKACLHSSTVRHSIRQALRSR